MFSFLCVPYIVFAGSLNNEKFIVSPPAYGKRYNVSRRYYLFVNSF